MTKNNGLVNLYPERLYLEWTHQYNVTGTLKARFNVFMASDTSGQSRTLGRVVECTKCGYITLYLIGFIC